MTVSLDASSETGPKHIAIVPSGSNDGSGKYTAEYSIVGIERGTYTMRVTKKGHITGEYMITIGDEPTEKNVTLRLIGDVDANGMVDAADALMALQSSVRKLTLTDQDFAAADVNTDGKISAVDALRILQCAVGIIHDPSV